MVPVSRVRFYIEGAEYSFSGKSNDKWIAGAPSGCEFPKAAVLGFINRAVKEMLSPNSRTSHRCGYACKRTIGILIGRSTSLDNELSLVDAVPR